jgi:hypothetical protein
MVRQLFRGVFNYHRSVVTEYVYAISKRQAWLLICKRLAKRDGVLPMSVMQLFDGSRDNFSIEIEMEVKEVETPMVETATPLL